MEAQDVFHGLCLLFIIYTTNKHACSVYLPDIEISKYIVIPNEGDYHIVVQRGPGAEPRWGPSWSRS